MTRLVHLSDLHFGRVATGVVEPLLKAVQAADPDLTVVSGDFVQDGKASEFESARHFVRRLPNPRLLVPGNHDMPFRNLIARFLVGLDLYREYIAEDLEPFWTDGDVAVMGVNTARRWPIRGGRISEEQIRRVEEQLCSLDGDVAKILVTHHPFDLAESYHRDELVGRARMAMGRFAQTIDVLMAGHMHVGHWGRTGVRYRLQGRSAVFVQAGTATSSRGRGEPNTFNVLNMDRRTLCIERHQWDRVEGRFHCVSEERFALTPEPAACKLPPEVRAREAKAQDAKAEEVETLSS